MIVKVKVAVLVPSTMAVVKVMGWVNAVSKLDVVLSVDDSGVVVLGSTVTVTVPVPLVTVTMEVRVLRPVELGVGDVMAEEPVEVKRVVEVVGDTVEDEPGSSASGIN